MQNRLLNKCVDAEKPAGSRVLLTQDPRPSRFSGHDSRWVQEDKNKISGVIMRSFYQKYLGLYRPAFFSIYINADFKDGNLSNLADEDVSTYIHEFVHYVQDITTTYGLMNICHIVELQKNINKRILDGSSKHFKLPILFETSHPANINIELTSLYAGSRQIKNNTISSIESVYPERNGLIPGYEAVPAITVNYKGNQDLKSFYFGSICIQESMAHLIEQMLGKGTNHPDFPYRTVEYLVENVYPEFLLNKKGLVYLCDISLGTFHPGQFFYEILTRMKEEEFLPKSYHDLFKFCMQYKFDKNGHEKNISALFEDTSKMARNFLPEFITIPIFTSIKEWLENIIDSGYAVRKSDFCFWSNILEFSDRKGRLEAFRDILLKKLESPILSDSNFCHYICKSNIDLEKHIVAFLAICELHDILTINKQDCGLYEYCRRHSKEDITSSSCKAAPWTRASEDNLCPFGQVWRMWGLKDFEPTFI